MSHKDISKEVSGDIALTDAQMKDKYVFDGRWGSKPNTMGELYVMVSGALEHPDLDIYKGVAFKRLRSGRILITRPGEPTLDPLLIATLEKNSLIRALAGALEFPPLKMAQIFADAGVTVGDLKNGGLSARKVLETTIDFLQPIIMHSEVSPKLQPNDIKLFLGTPESEKWTLVQMSKQRNSPWDARIISANIKPIDKPSDVLYLKRALGQTYEKLRWAFWRSSRNFEGDVIAAADSAQPTKPPMINKDANPPPVASQLGGRSPQEGMTRRGLLVGLAAAGGLATLAGIFGRRLFQSSGLSIPPLKTIGDKKVVAVHDAKGFSTTPINGPGIAGQTVTFVGDALLEMRQLDRVLELAIVPQDSTQELAGFELQFGNGYGTVDVVRAIKQGDFWDRSSPTTIGTPLEQSLIKSLKVQEYRIDNRAFVRVLMPSSVFKDNAIPTSFTVMTGQQSNLEDGLELNLKNVPSGIALRIYEVAPSKTGVAPKTGVQPKMSPDRLKAAMLSASAIALVVLGLGLLGTVLVPGASATPLGQVAPTDIAGPASHVLGFGIYAAIALAIVYAGLKIVLSLLDQSRERRATLNWLHAKLSRVNLKIQTTASYLFAIPASLVGKYVFRKRLEEMLAQMQAKAALATAA